MNWNTPESVIEEQLGRDERLLWSGQPPGGLRLSLIDVFVIPFSLLWCDFAISWVVSAYAMGAAALLRAIWHAVRPDRPLPRVRAILC